MIQTVDRTRPSHFLSSLEALSHSYLSISALSRKAEQSTGSAVRGSTIELGFKRRGPHDKGAAQQPVPTLKSPTEQHGAPLHKEKPRRFTSVLLEYGSPAKAALSALTNLLVVLVTGLLCFPSIIRAFAIVDDEIDSGW